MIHTPDDPLRKPRSDKGTQRRPLADRFWEKVEKKAQDECWPWLGSQHARGYGEIWSEGKARKATQVSWEIENGKPFPKGKVACHSCDNPNCVNPSHIWPGSIAQNTRDCFDKQRHPGPRREVLPTFLAQDLSAEISSLICRHGHALVGDNIKARNSGGIVCRACANERTRFWKRRKMATIASNIGNAGHE